MGIQTQLTCDVCGKAIPHPGSMEMPDGWIKIFMGELGPIQHDCCSVGCAQKLLTDKLASKIREGQKSLHTTLGSESESLAPAGPGRTEISSQTESQVPPVADVKMRIPPV